MTNIELLKQKLYPVGKGILRPLSLLIFLYITGYILSIGFTS